MPAARTDEDLLDTLTREADTRMYEAKRSGRDRTVFPIEAGT